MFIKTSLAATFAALAAANPAATNPMTQATSGGICMKLFTKFGGKLGQLKCKPQQFNNMQEPFPKNKECRDMVVSMAKKARAKGCGECVRVAADYLEISQACMNPAPGSQEMKDCQNKQKDIFKRGVEHKCMPAYTGPPAGSNPTGEPATGPATAGNNATGAPATGPAGLAQIFAMNSKKKATKKKAVKKAAKKKAAKKAKKHAKKVAKKAKKNAKKAKKAKKHVKKADKKAKKESAWKWIKRVYNPYSAPRHELKKELVRAWGKADGHFRWMVTEWLKEMRKMYQELPEHRRAKAKIYVERCFASESCTERVLGYEKHHCEKSHKCAESMRQFNGKYRRYITHQLLKCVKKKHEKTCPFTSHLKKKHEKKHGKHHHGHHHGKHHKHK